MGRPGSSDWADQVPSGRNGQEPYLRLHHVPIFVRDQDRSLHFYLEQLGFSLVIDYDHGEHGRFILVSPPDGTALLALIGPKPESEEYKLIGHSAHCAVFVTEDVTAKFHTWLERGVRFRHPPRASTWGGIVASFEDLDGNSFVLAGWDDLTREIETQRRTLAEKLESDRRALRELEIAKQVQARLFPQTTPPLKTLEYTGICIQAREVGGDYYDFLNLGEQRLGLVIGDVSGKGIAAALLMANLQANLRSQFAMAVDEPYRFLQSVNQLFYENTTDNIYATLFFAQYQDEGQCLRYANCGHLSALLLRHDRILERLDSTCTVLGLFKEWNCEIQEKTLCSGDTLVLYTDGVTESLNDAGEEFGEHRLIEALLRHNELDSQALLAGIVNELREFSPHEQQDDITLIVARCKENGSVLTSETADLKRGKQVGS
jgi:phosphoserine phosphatase RsbU/P